MFDDLEKKSTSPLSSSPPAAPAAAKAPATLAAAEEEIHTMPMEYYLGEKTAELTKGEKVTVPAGQTVAVSASRKRIWNLVIIVVLVIIVAGSAYLLLKSYQKPAVTPEPVKIVTPAPAPVIEESILTPAPVQPAPTEPAKVAPKFNPAEIKKFTLSLLAGPDQDKDGLTDAEELLFGMKTDSNDSDGDVYKDKEEIANFYSPVDKGNVRLWEKSFVSYYTNKNYGYKILYPTAWLIQPLDNVNPKDLMISSNQNEFINIVVLDKEKNQSLTDWYLGLAANVKLGELKQYQTFNKLPLLESPDAFTVYIENENKDQVFAINYNIGLKEEANFPVIFQIVVNSFVFVPMETTTPVLPPTGATSGAAAELGELPLGE